MYALFIDGVKFKISETLPTLDQSYPVGMAPGHEWLTIVDDPNPAFDPMTQQITVSEVVEPGRILRKTKTAVALSAELAAAQVAIQQAAATQAAIAGIYAPVEYQGKLYPVDVISMAKYEVAKQSKGRGKLTRTPAIAVDGSILKLSTPAAIEAFHSAMEDALTARTHAVHDAI